MPAILACLAFGADPSPSGTKPTAAPHLSNRLSWYTLLANPGAHDGKVITLSGVLRGGNSSIVLYPNREDAQCRRYENQINVMSKAPKRFTALVKLDGMCVVITGRFSLKPVNKDDPSVEYYLDLWGVEEFAMDSPFRGLYRAALDLPTMEEVRKTPDKDLLGYFDLVSTAIAFVKESEKDDAAAHFLATFPKQEIGLKEYIAQSIKRIDAQVTQLLGPDGPSLPDLDTVAMRPGARFHPEQKLSKPPGVDPFAKPRDSKKP